MRRWIDNWIWNHDVAMDWTIAAFWLLVFGAGVGFTAYAFIVTAGQ